MEIDYRRIGRHLRAAREHNNLTQAPVAEIIGVAESSFSNMERGQQKLSLKRIIELCVLYKIKPGSVLDDCCDELIDLDEIHLEQNPDKRDTIGILEKSSDETVHLINLIAHTLYKDQKA